MVGFSFSANKKILFRGGEALSLVPIALGATLAALPGLKTLGLTEELLVRTAMESGNINNPYSFSEEERLSFLRSVY